MSTKPKTIDTLSREAAKRLHIEPGSRDYDYFRAGFSRGIRCARNRAGWLMVKNRMIPAILD